MLVFLSYLTGPMLYLYFRSVLNDNAQIKPKDLWHLLPAFIFLLGTINYIITPWSFKLEIASHLVENPSFVAKFDHVYLYNIISPKLVYLSRPVLILIYTFASILSLVRFVKRKTEKKVIARRKYVIKWLLVMLGFLFVLVVSHTLLIKVSFDMKDLALFYTLNIYAVSFRFLD